MARARTPPGDDLSDHLVDTKLLDAWSTLADGLLARLVTAERAGKDPKASASALEEAGEALAVARRRFVASLRAPTPKTWKRWRRGGSGTGSRRSNAMPSDEALPRGLALG